MWRVRATGEAEDARKRPPPGRCYGPSGNAGGGNVAKNVAVSGPTNEKSPKAEASGLCKNQVAGWTGIEPATSGVTGRRSNQLSYHPTWPLCDSALPLFALLRG